MFAGLTSRLSNKKGRFVAVVFTSTSGRDKIRAGMEQSPRQLAEGVRLDGKKIIGAVNANNRKEFLIKLKKIKGVPPKSAESIEETFGVEE